MTAPWSTCLSRKKQLDNRTLLTHEWQTLQNNHEQYEKSALLIKLTSLVLCIAGLATHIPLPWLGVTVILCWLLEGIYKTYQSRLAERLLHIELLLRQAEPAAEAMQLYTAWSANRPGGLGLVAAYVASALKPTVAFPYLPILVLGCLAQLSY